MTATAVRAVSFDANGTLIHSPRLGEIYAGVLRRHGITVSADETLRVVRNVWQEFSCATRLGENRFASHPDGARGWWYRFIDRVCDHLGVVSASRFAKAELFERFASRGAWEVYDEVPEVLDALHEQGMRLVVVSNWDDRLPALLESLELADFFQSIVYSAAVGAEKPSSRIFHEALETLGLPPEQVIHVGDRKLEDVEGAQAVGMEALHLTRGGNGGDVKDLRPLVDRVGGRW